MSNKLLSILQGILLLLKLILLQASLLKQKAQLGVGQQRHVERIGGGRKDGQIWWLLERMAAAVVGCIGQGHFGADWQQIARRKVMKTGS